MHLANACTGQIKRPNWSLNGHNEQKHAEFQTHKFQLFLLSIHKENLLHQVHEIEIGSFYLNVHTNLHEMFQYVTPPACCALKPKKILC